MHFAFSGNYYVFKKIDDYFQIYVADYERNPFKDFAEDLTLSLNIMKEQLLMTKKIGIMSFILLGK